MKFTHLHLHTEYSLLDGANKIKTLAKKIKELGMDSVAMTDHGNMFGAIDFYITMKKAGIKPIIGMETYLHNQEGLNDKTQKQRFHLCLYAKNEVGYKNLIYLSSMAYIDGFYYYPRINKKILREHSEGLICSSACLQGEVSWNLNTNNPRNARLGAKGFATAKDVALEYRDIFGDDFYLEIMRHGIADQASIDEHIIDISLQTGIKIIATNDTHYTLQEDASAQEIAMCIAMGNTVNDPNRLKHSVKEFYIKSPQEMMELFSDIPEAIENTQEIAQKCNLEIPLKNMEIIEEETKKSVLEYTSATPPSFRFTKEYAQKENLENINSDADFFAYKCREGLEKRLKNIPQEEHEKYKNRLELEIEVINKMNFPGYMLIVWDFVNFAKNNNIPVGPGRGSAAGSLVAFCLNITDINPLKYDLLFERFLNPDRVSMPDIDMDFCQRRRGEVIEYVTKQYGKYNVAQVITFGSLNAKGVIRDVARVLDMPYNEADSMAKLIPNELKITLKDAIEKEPKLQELIQTNPKANEVWKFSLMLEGMKRNSGTHAAAVVIDPQKELWHKTPLYTSERLNGAMATQYSMNFLEPVDLIKFDFLGLKTLTVINDTLTLIKKRYDKEIDFTNVDTEDPNVYKTIQSGNTLGLFQIESGGMQDLNKRLKPTTFEDMIAILALYRPGPMESGMLDDFIERKHGRRSIEYAFPQLEPILKPTYGVIVYQEQVMQIVQTIGGFSLGQADLVRRAMGKKKHDEMEKLKNEFGSGAESLGFDRRKAEELWELIVKFAGYGFNKSHSTAYAMITFQTAYLKTYYEHEFMAAMLTSETNKIESVAKYIDEVKAMDIEVIPPHVNISDHDFGVGDFDGCKKIIFGLSAIKGAGDAPVENIIEERAKNGEYKDLSDFICRVDWSKLTKRILEPLIKSGTLDGLGYTRASMLANIDRLCEIGRAKEKADSMMENSLFGEEPINNEVHIDIENIQEFDTSVLLDYEYECMGIYISGHPLDPFKDEINSINGVIKSSQIQDLKNDDDVFLIGKVINENKKTSKNGRSYSIVEVLDLHGKFDFTLFENQVEKLEKLNKNEPVSFKCKVEEKGDKRQLKVVDILTTSEAKKKKIKQRAETQQPTLQSTLALIIREGTNPDTLENLEQIVKSNLGDRKFVVIIEGSDSDYLFESDYTVREEIKTSLPNLEWKDL